MNLRTREPVYEPKPTTRFAWSTEAPADAILSMCAFLCQKGAGANSGAIGLVTMCGSAVS